MVHATGPDGARSHGGRAPWRRKHPRPEFPKSTPRSSARPSARPSTRPRRRARSRSLRPASAPRTWCAAIAEDGERVLDVQSALDMKPMFEVRTSTIHGRGVFARRPIAAGTRVIEYAGELISEREG